MKKRFLLLIIFIIFIFSLVTFILILNYLDPYEHNITAISSIIFAFTSWLSSFITLIFYFFKKIYFRWRVYVFHVLSSFRQWFLISLFFIWMFYFNLLWASLIITWFALLLILVFIEMFIQNLKK